MVIFSSSRTVGCAAEVGPTMAVLLVMGRSPFCVARAYGDDGQWASAAVSRRTHRRHFRVVVERCLSFRPPSTANLAPCAAVSPLLRRLLYGLGFIVLLAGGRRHRHPVAHPATALAAGAHRRPVRPGRYRLRQRRHPAHPRRQRHRRRRRARLRARARPDVPDGPDAPRRLRPAVRDRRPGDARATTAPCARSACGGARWPTIRPCPPRPAPCWRPMRAG